MVEIKSDEISAILRQQLSNFNASSDLEEVGSVLQVGDGIARVYGLNNVRSGELVEFETGVQAIALNLEEDNVGVVLMGDWGGIKEGSKVRRTGKIASINVGAWETNRITCELPGKSAITSASIPASTGSGSGGAFGFCASALRWSTSPTKEARSPGRSWRREHTLALQSRWGPGARDGRRSALPRPQARMSFLR